MPPLSIAAISVALTAAVAGIVAGAVAEIPSGRSAPRLPEAPLAALAWAQLQCNSELAPRPGTARVHAEDLMRVSFEFDAMRAAEGHTIACARAIASARPVAVTATFP